VLRFHGLQSCELLTIILKISILTTLCGFYNPRGLYIP